MAAGLLLNVNRPMSKADLMRTAWEGEEVQEAQLHKRVMAARDVLGKIGRREDIVTHQRFGYELRAGADEVDARRFLRLVQEADEAGPAGYTGNEVSLLREAIGLWRGPHPLANVPGEMFAAEAMALEQRHKRLQISRRATQPVASPGPCSRYDRPAPGMAPTGRGH